MTTSQLEEQLSTAKALYLEERDRVVKLHERLVRHRKSLQASNDHADNLDKEWRRLFREEDGRVTQRIRSIQREVTETRDQADEFQLLINEQEPMLELHQVKLHELRENYLRKLQAYREQAINGGIREAINELSDSEPFQRLAQLLQERQNQVRSELIDQLPGYSNFGILNQEDQKDLDNRTNQAMAMELLEMLQTVPVPDGDPITESPHPVDRLPEEGDLSKLQSVAYRATARKRLQQHEQSATA